jgi:hypothetical protein
VTYFSRRRPYLSPLLLAAACLKYTSMIPSLLFSKNFHRSLERIFTQLSPGWMRAQLPSCAALFVMSRSLHLSVWLCLKRLHHHHMLRRS